MCSTQLNLYMTNPNGSIYDRAQRLSALQNGVIGSLSGMVETLIQQPTVAIKNAIQVRIITHA